MTDDQIIHDVLENLNKWDRDNRNTTMSIPFYIKEKFKLEERECFKLTTQMVEAGLVSRYRDNDYIIKDKGREIADTPDGWLGKNKKIVQPPLTPFLYLNTKPVSLQHRKPLKNHIPSWMIWLKEKKSELVIGTIITIIAGTFILILEYKSGYFIKNDTNVQPPTDTLSYKPTLKIKPVKQNKTTDSLPTRTNLPVRQSNKQLKTDSI